MGYKNLPDHVTDNRIIKIIQELGGSGTYNIVWPLYYEKYGERDMQLGLYRKRKTIERRMRHLNLIGLLDREYNSKREAVFSVNNSTVMRVPEQPLPNYEDQIEALA